MICVIATYVGRFLPIHFRVYTTILITVYIVVSILINKISINKSIFCILIEFIILSICKVINFSVLHWLSIDVYAVLRNPVKKVLYLAPSLILFNSLVALLYVAICKIEKITYIISVFCRMYGINYDNDGIKIGVIIFDY